MKMKILLMGLVLMLGGVATAATQIIDINNGGDTITRINTNNFSFDINHKTDDTSDLKGVGFSFHFDSSVLKFESISNLYVTDITAGDNTAQNDAENEDDDSSTDKKLNFAWAKARGWDIGNEQKLLTAEFAWKSSATKSSTVVHFVKVSQTDGREFSFIPATLEITGPCGVCAHATKTSFVETTSGMVSAGGSRVWTMRLKDFNGNNTANLGGKTITASVTNITFGSAVIAMNIIQNDSLVVATYNYNSNDFGRYKVEFKLGNDIIKVAGGGAPTTLIVNDSPMITTSPTISIAEDQTTVLTVSATDANISKGDTLTFSIAGGVDSSIFNISTRTGVLTFKALPDYESDKKSYAVILGVSDTFSVASTKALTVTITNVLENIITINSDQTRNIAENSDINTNVGEVVKTTGNPSTYTITSHIDKFAISSSGQITTKKSFNFEVDAKSYDLTIRISKTDAADKVAMITVKITDVDEAPTIVGGTIKSIDVVQGVTAVATINASDPDADDIIITFALSGANSALFTITNAGVLTFKDAQVFDSKMATNNIKKVIVTASSNGKSASQTITVITISNLHPPVIINGDTNFAENAIWMFTINATDADATSESQTLNYSIAGDDADLFILKGRYITFKDAPDFEIKSSYKLTLKVGDGISTTSKDITITIINVLENSIDIADQSFSVAENAGMNSVFGTIATTGTPIGITILRGNEDKKFNIKADGNIEVKGVLDYEGTKTYDLTVQITKTDAEIKTAVVTINVTNVLEINSWTTPTYKATAMVRVIALAHGSRTVRVNSDEGTLTITLDKITQTAQVATGDDKIILLPSGAYTITWRATLDSDPKLFATATQLVNITPRVNFAKRQLYSSQGQTVTITMSLSGLAAAYPVSIPFTATGSASNTYVVSNPTISITQGTQGTATIFLATATGVVNVTMVTPPTNAVQGKANRVAINVLIDNVAPRIKGFSVKQEEIFGRIVKVGSSVVKVTADAVDANGDALTYTWTGATGSGKIATFIASRVVQQEVSLLVTDGTLTTKASIKINVVASDVIVKTDEDDNGIPDSEEEANHDPKVLKTTTGKAIVTSAGKIRVGRMALTGGSARITITALQKHVKDNSKDATSSNIKLSTGEIFDYSIADLNIGATATIVIELDNKLPAGHELWKYSLVSDSWKPFVTSLGDSYYSSTVANCDGGWQQGKLITDAVCLKLIIQDGGENDDDNPLGGKGLRNGNIEDPVGVFAPTPTTNTYNNASGGCVLTTTDKTSSNKFDPLFYILLLISVVAVFRKKSDNLKL